MGQHKTITLQLTADPNLQVEHEIRNGDEVQLYPAKRIRFRSVHSFSLLLDPASPFVDSRNTIPAIQHGDEWLVEAQFRPDAVNKPTYTVAVNQTAPTTAQPYALAGAGATPQVEVILEQY